MFLVVSLDNTKKRKVASKRKGPSSSSKSLRRVSKKEFLKLSPNKQKSYLERFPQSSHRFLIKKGKKSADAIRKVSRSTYDHMTKAEQRAYDRAHKCEKKFRGKKHVSLIQSNPILAKLRNKRINGGPVTNKLSKLAEAEAKVADAQRSRYASEIKAGITPEAMDAIKHVKQGDLDKAADNLMANKSDVLEEFEAKLERDRLDHVELTDDDRAELERVVAKGKDPNSEELEEIIKTKKPTAKQKKVAEEALGRKPRNFFQRDMDALGAIIRGEKVDNRGKSNFMTAMTILGRYAMIAGGVAAISMGAAPLAIHIVKEIYDNWQSIGASDDKNEFTIEHAYDAIVDHMRNADLDALGGLAKRAKFVSTSASSRIAYRCLPDERMLPFVKRTAHRVMLNGQQIGQIRAESSDLAAPNVRIWTAHITEGFDPLDFPHVDDPDAMKEPYILTNDDSDVQHNLELHCPLLMTLQEARAWVCQIVEK